MHRIDTPTAQVDKFGAGKNGFTIGNPQTGELPTALDADFFDAVQEELCAPIEAAGLTVDKSKKNQLLAALKLLFLQPSNAFSEIKSLGAASQAKAVENLGVRSVLAGITGSTRNLAMNVTSASASATVAADEIIVSTSLGGSQYRIGSFSKTINLATTGAGGMDASTVPANGFVGIYAIYNPVTGASALLAVNAASVIGEVYGGNNMPSGYSASALLTIVPTASSQFKIVTVVGRSVYFGASTILSTSSNLTPTQISISSIAPLNSKLIEGLIALGSTSAGTLSVTLNSSNTSQGIRQFGAYTPASAVVSSGYTGMPITIPGYIYVSTSNATSGTGSFVIYCSGFTI
ncbi:MAG: phage tail protein [Pantoea ananatis]|nr:phage tail protein [Pantoea ananatis]